VSVTVDEDRNWRRSAGSSCDHALMTGRALYRSWMSDNLRWDALALREGDIVICAPPKCGTTWTQRLVSLLVFNGPDMPGPMSMLSPWLDLTVQPIEEVVAALDAQEHRRFIKTHTPLDGLVLDDRVTYIGVGRDPRDAAVSMLMDRDRMQALHQVAGPPHERSPQRGPDPDGERSPLEVLRSWMERPVMPPKGIVSLATIFHHFGSLWHRRHLPNVALFHYADYQVDLVGELVRLAAVLGIDVTRDRAAELAEHATLDAMRARASELTPDLWPSHESVFRAGGRGTWRDIFTEAVHRRYRERAAQLAPQDILAWAHDGRRGHDPTGRR
jgi:aryl sulfotransferase